MKKPREKAVPFRFKLHTDSLLVTVSFSLLLLGFVMVSSASLHLGAKMNDDTLYYPLRQFVHMVLGLTAAMFVAYRPMHFWREYGNKAFIFGVILLIVVLIPGLGVKVNGSTRWLNIPGFRVQVSEIVKFFTVIFMANYVTRQQRNVQESSTALLKPLGLFAGVSLLLLLEPDFGSAVVMLVIVMGVMFLAGARLLQFIALLSIVGILALTRFCAQPEQGFSLDTARTQPNCSLDRSRSRGKNSQRDSRQTRSASLFKRLLNQNYA